MILKIIWALILLALGLSSINNYFEILPNLIILSNDLVMLITGLAVITASLIIFIQTISLKLHQKY